MHFGRLKHRRERIRSAYEYVARRVEEVVDEASSKNHLEKLFKVIQVCCNFFVYCYFLLCLLHPLVIPLDGHPVVKVGNYFQEGLISFSYFLFSDLNSVQRDKRAFSSVPSFEPIFYIFKEVLVELHFSRVILCKGKDLPALDRRLGCYYFQYFVPAVRDKRYG